MSEFKVPEYGFNVCRVCTLPEDLLNGTKLKNLFEEPPKYKNWLRMLSGIKISEGQENQKALICAGCFGNLQAVITIRRKARKAEKVYFEARRRGDTEKTTSKRPRNDLEKNQKTVKAVTEPIFELPEADAPISDSADDDCIIISVEEPPRKRTRQFTSKNVRTKYKCKEIYCNKTFPDEWSRFKHHKFHDKLATSIRRKMVKVPNL